jgi:DNA 3'-phosphatase
MDVNKKKVLFIDLDDTLIKTVSGETFPKDVTDFQIRKEVVDRIRSMQGLQRVAIVSNQGGIPEFVTEEDFKAKLKAIEFFIFVYCGVAVSSHYCIGMDKTNPRRKPNIGMFEEVMEALPFTLKKKECMLMVGDASGKDGDFSVSDKKAAEDFGIDYMDVEDFKL